MSAQPMLADYLATNAALIEAELKRSLPEAWAVPPRLRESMDYSLSAGGKRLRPVLVLAAAEAARGGEADREAALRVACAVEMIHTYSLIHDDLPAMDNDDYRRGKPTNHKVFGEAMAILAGDGLLTHAFHMASSARRFGADTAVVLDIVEDLSRLSGPAGMVGGQAADMQGEQGATTLPELQYIHEHKTSDLVIFSVTAGARLGGASSEQLARLEQFGRKLGLAFQIQDDILDLIGDESKLGKKTNSDTAAGKVTYPYLVGMDESRRLLGQFTAEAKQALLEARLPKPERLAELADYLMNRDR
ncbi:polyprenyl synthetase family protein [Paenibacillus pasadenensis]|uniref:Farnesyl diphosphate synthase n=1 Tax=Paenibacillus pasadenensis TaxID=217090 RepID=A0A2N5N5E0_9BACL|nr:MULTISPECIES: farnesyl diphosphate synthase [Paenibacillus]PLT45558.1 Octaprenyl diphosphate synthase [Paenibacillus pasadenensis]QGG56020.1 polyprenyl synthetase family protein [Paenibacillus sp. B01]